jgi:hypothetical protein
VSLPSSSRTRRVPRESFGDGVHVGYRLVGLLLGDEPSPAVSLTSDIDTVAAQLYIASRDSYGQIVVQLPSVLQDLRDQAVLRLVERWRVGRPSDAVTRLRAAAQAGLQSGVVVGLMERDQWVTSRGR